MFTASRRSLTCLPPNLLSSSRALSSSLPQRTEGKDIGPGKEHTLDKAVKGDPNVQSYESHQGRKNREQDTGGTATQQRDLNSATSQAKKDFPEAPDAVIGMQDERGGKGR